MKKVMVFGISVIAAALLLSVLPANAQSFGSKISRGIGNGVLFPLELPKEMGVEWRNNGAGYGLTVGIFKGIGWSIVRGATGVYEFVTSPIPVPSNYRAILYPEYVTQEWEVETHTR